VTPDVDLAVYGLSAEELVSAVSSLT